MDSKFRYGTLISICITVFTIISIIYPIFFTHDKTTNNINRDIIKLRDTLNLDFSFDNYDDFKNISTTIGNSDLSRTDFNDNYCLNNDNSHNKIKNMSIFLSILAYREEKILLNDSDSINDKSSMEHYLKCFVDNKYVDNNKNFGHNDILWYPLRQLKLERQLPTDYFFNKANGLQLYNDKIKEEDFYCNELTNNSFIDEFKKLIGITQSSKNLYDTSYCSKTEMENIIKYSEKYPYVINILNDNLNNTSLNITQKFRLFVDYFWWFTLLSFITGPVAFILWIRNYVIQ